MRRYVWIFASLLLMVCFQNCAKVGVDSQEIVRTDKYGSIVVEANQDGHDLSVMPGPGGYDEPHPGEDPVTLCEMLLRGNQGQKLVYGLNAISSDRGAMYVSSSDISVIDDYRGKLLVMGPADGSRLKIGRIQGNRGRLILCNADVGELSDSRGRIDLVNSTIASCSDKVGNIKMDAKSSVPSDCGHNTKVVALKH